MKQAVQVTILGQQYMVKSTALPDEVRRVADFVNARIEEVMSTSRTVDSLNVAVLALMNVSGCYLRLLERVPDDGRIEQHLRRLLDRLEQAPAEAAKND